MSFCLKRLFLSMTFNLSLFMMLIIGIQNSANNSKVKFLKNRTVDLPISFIIGASFISGSLTGSFINLNFRNKKN